MIIPLAFAFGGVGFPSLFLAFRGRVALQGGPGAACLGDVATSTANIAENATSGATSGDNATSQATINDIAPEC